MLIVSNSQNKFKELNPQNEVHQITFITSNAQDKGYRMLCPELKEYNAKEMKVSLAKT